MASLESMAIRCDMALAEIENVLGDMLGADLEAVPRVHRDREMLRVIQLEQIAKWLKELQEAESVPVKDAKAMFEASMTNFPQHKPVANAAPRKPRK